MKYSIVITFLLSSMLLAGPAGSNEPAERSLYERLGGMEGIDSIVRKTIALHMDNPDIAAYVRHVDQEWLIGSVTAFFAAGSGGPNHYQGTDMHTAHAHLDLTDSEFDAAVADVLASLNAHDIDAESHAEVSAILESFRGQVVTAKN